MKQDHGLCRIADVGMDVAKPKMTTSYRLTSFCGMFNPTGKPVGCVCAGFNARGLPIGVQLIGRHFDGRGVMQLAQLCEEIRGFTGPWPELA